MKTTLIIIGVALFILICLFAYGACKAAGMADDAMDKAIEENKQFKKKYNETDI